MAVKKAPAKRGPGRPRVGTVARSSGKVSRTAGYIRIGVNTVSLIENPEQVLEWDDDELRMGCRRNEQGRFPSEKSMVVPRVVYDELMRRTIDTCLEKMRFNMPEMIDVMMTIVRDPGVMAKDKLKAIEMMMNRVFGKPTERHVISVGRERKAWQEALDIAIVSEPATAEDEEFE